MKKAIVLFLIKKAVKYLKNHPDVIPGEIDNVAFTYLAKLLGV